MSVTEGVERVFVCKVCGYVYDEDRESVKWEDLPDHWECPACGSPKASFDMAENVKHQGG